MNKIDYLDLLRYYLKDLPRPVVDEIVYDYEEHFNIGMAMGKSEEEITRELGYPDDVAEEYLKGDFTRKTEEPKEEETHRAVEKQGTSNKILWIIILLLFSPFILSLVFAVLAMIFASFVALFGTGVGIFFGGLAVIISLFPGFGDIVSLSLSHPLSKTFLGIAMTCLGVVLIYLGIKFLQFVGRSVKRAWLTTKWKWVRK